MHVPSELIDGVAMNADNPDTFTIPDAAVREALMKGEVVKIGLTFVPEKGSSSGERFWVEIQERTVTARGAVQYRGRIVNHLVCEHGFDWDDIITFAPQHVLDVATTKAATMAQRKKSTKSATRKSTDQEKHEAYVNRKLAETFTKAMGPVLGWTAKPKS